jgi:putative ABC transport system permease protein
MIIGSASIIAVFGISRAATSGITSTFASFGTFPVFLGVDNSQNDPTIAAMHYRDVAAVSEALGDRAADVIPFWQRNYQVAVGNTHDYESVQDQSGVQTDTLAMSEGRKLDQNDAANAARVCVMTQDLATKYFHGAPAVGNYLRINGDRCQVVGVYADIKGSFLNNANSATIFIPTTTFNDMFSPGDLDAILIYPSDPAQADSVGAIAVTALQHIHSSRAQYRVQNSAGFISGFDNALDVIATGLSAIGGVALVVAGIGIMNIMLVSVTERTREIGIRKAIGANRGNIILQFLMEAVVLSLIGGGIGMGLGLLVTIGAAELLSKQLGDLLIPYLLIISIALTFSITIGMVFGTYPAIRAAGLDPIEALRS